MTGRLSRLYRIQTSKPTIAAIGGYCVAVGVVNRLVADRSDLDAARALALED